MLCNAKVDGWAAESLTSLDSRDVFSAPEISEWIAYDKIAIVDAFKSAKTVLDLFAQLADSVMKLKVKTPGEIQRVHRLLEQLQPSIVSFQAGNVFVLIHLVCSYIVVQDIITISLYTRLFNNLRLLTLDGLNSKYRHWYIDTLYYLTLINS